MILKKLRKIQNYTYYKCGAKLYDIDFNVPIRKWSQKCWSCGKETPMITYILKDNEFGDCIIGSHIEIDLILQSEYKFVDRNYSNITGQNIIGNLCVHCGKYQSTEFIEDELFFEDDVNYEKYFPFDRVLSKGDIKYLDRNENNKELNNRSSERSKNIGGGQSSFSFYI